MVAEEKDWERLSRGVDTADVISFLKEFHGPGA